MRQKALWRSPDLGQSGEIELPQGRLRYFEAGRGPTLVFIHGVFVNANIWRKLVPLLAPDFRCVALDLPLGAHTIPMTPDADLSERGIIDLIAGAIEALDLYDVTLVGVDTGGAICQFVVTQRPERIGGLVLCSCDYRDNFPPPLFLHMKLFPYIAPIAPVLYAPFRLRAARRLPFAFGWLVNEQVERVVEDSWMLPALQSRAIRRDAAKMLSIFNKRRSNETADLLHTFNKPALIAWSENDRTMPVAHGEQLARDLPRARLELIEGARTFSMEDQPNRLAEAIAGFMREPREPLSDLAADRGARPTST